MLNFIELLNKDPFARISLRNRVDKNGRFYHVVQRAANRENIFDKETARYRTNLLCRICTMYNVTILFSVVMSNHTHDILMAESWEIIAKVMKEVNSALSRKLRKENKEKYTNGRRIFETEPFYRAIHDMIDLMVTSKYVYDNAKSIEDKGKFVPYSCFWQMRNDRLSKPYNKELYPILFGMNEQDLCTFFETHSSGQIANLAAMQYKNWTQKDNDTFFKANPTLPWLGL